MTAAGMWPLPPQTAAKHTLLREYLNAWFPKLAHGGMRKMVYIDGFAGPAVYAGGEDGSPLIALKALVERSDFDQWSAKDFIFLFNELDPDCFASLKSQVNAYMATRSPWPANVQVAAENQPFDVAVSDLIDVVYSKGAQLAPTFAFIDPFGVQGVPLQKIGKLLASPSCEMLLYLSFNEIQRFATAGQIDDHLTELFGSDAFKSCPPAGNPSRRRWLRDLFVQQMKDVGGFTYVLAFEMVHANGNIGSYLVHGTRHLDGLGAMKRAMWKIDPTGDFRFSVRHSGAAVLFSTASPENCQDIIHAQFTGTTVTIEQVREFVLVETIYPDGFIKQKSLGPLEKDGRISNVDRGGAVRGFPDGCRITFA